MVFYSGGSRPSDNGGEDGGHPDPELSGGRGGLQNIFFRPFGPQFRQKIRGMGGRGGGGERGQLPWIRHCLMYS